MRSRRRRREGILRCGLRLMTQLSPVSMGLPSGGPATVAKAYATDPAPWPYGLRSAIGSVGSVASPLLAGFSFALIGLIIPSTSAIRWPGVSLALLVVSGVAFVMAVQCGFWAQLWVVMPSEVDEWKPNAPQGQRYAE